MKSVETLYREVAEELRFRRYDVNKMPSVFGYVQCWCDLRPIEALTAEEIVDMLVGHDRNTPAESGKYFKIIRRYLIS